MAKREKKVFNHHDVYYALGVCLLLLGLLLVLSPLSPRLRYFSYPFILLFGQLGFYSAVLACLIGGLHLLFHQKVPAFSTRVRIGLLLCFFGLSVLLGFIFLFPDGVDGAFYMQTINDTFAQGPSAIYGGAYQIFGGIVGYSISAFLCSVSGAYLPIVLSSIVILGGAILALFPLIKDFFSYAKAKQAIKKANRAKAEEEEIYEISAVGEEDRPVLSRPEPKKAEPVVRRPEPEPIVPSALEDDEPVRPSIVDEFVFERAGSAPLPTRRSLRQKEAAEQAAEEPKKIEDYVLTAPKEVPNPTVYRKTPLRSSGLQEAFFDPDETEFENPEAEEIPTPATKSEPFIEDVSQPSNAPINLLEADTEETYVPPSNDPIVLAPMLSDGLVAFPKSKPVEPEPEPKKEDDFIDLAAPLEDKSEPEPEPVFVEPEPIPVTPEPAPAPAPVPPKKEEKHEEEEEAKPLPPYEYPGLDLLMDAPGDFDTSAMEEEAQRKIGLINQIFVDFGIKALVTDHVIGPSVTRYYVTPDPGVSVERIGKVVKDLEMRLDGVPISFNERVAGSSSCTLEIANEVRRMVTLKEVMQGLKPRVEGQATLLIPFGVDINNKVQAADLAKFPHLLIAGTTGSGKSVFAHSILMSLIMRNRPEMLKLVLVDPKRVEMIKYKDLPHLLCPVVKESTEARNALKKLCDLMDERYNIFEKAAVQNILEYNNDYCEYAHKKKMPYIVVFIDELADLMTTCKDAAEHIGRLGAKARACGIHMIIATQRPDRTVITGTIKSNIPSRVALHVASAVDSQTILGFGGAEDLSNYGDMLIDCLEVSNKGNVRAQGCNVRPMELRAVTDFIRGQMEPQYDPEFLNLSDEDDTPGTIDNGAGAAPMPSPTEMKNASAEEKYQYIKTAIMAREFTSISQIQRDFGVGFPRAGKIFARLQAEGVVASSADTPNSSRGCRVLIHEAPSSNTNPGDAASTTTSFAGDGEDDD